MANENARLLLARNSANVALPAPRRRTVVSDDSLASGTPTPMSTEFSGPLRAVKNEIPENFVLLARIDAAMCGHGTDEAMMCACGHRHVLSMASPRAAPQPLPK
ncbi:hypothetical protein [Bradyrhizobium sp. 141]|uniref:hypothetical protein n=1 Tax=Bradyrhizobium sp. 141 TaxID=2782617 RepID=UPI001FF97599|nr:hypothetical protein [Bradyrhizobium sp. 141]MCK1718240.1 hypothetical protein [Bradyrhizobium sp. 141]